MLGDRGEVLGGNNGEEARGSARAIPLSLRCSVDGSASANVGNLGSLLSRPVLVTGRAEEVGWEFQLASELSEEDGPAWESVREMGDGILE